MSESGEKLTIEQEKQQKELLFSGGAGCIGFMMGYLHALIEILGKEKLKEYKLGGVSAGNAAALFFHMSLHQDEHDMKFFNEYEISKYFSKENRKYMGLFTNYKVIQQNVNTYCDKLQDLGDKIPNINGIYHCVVSEKVGLFKFRKVVLDKFENDELLNSSIQASCQIPFFTAPKVFKNHEGRKFVDGGLSGCIPYKYEHSQKIYINMLPKVTNFVAQIRNKTKNLKTLNIIDGQGISFPRDYYIWNEEWNDSMFLRGYLSAKQNIQEILDTFGVDQPFSKFSNLYEKNIGSQSTLPESEQEALIRKQIKEKESHQTSLLPKEIQF